ncbi:unnamed protein product [Spirodela intermedia]|uniref:Uncharacterized protein n=1 Tax=Spirodela intermedia TaxID=51605 RepID=A0A7I8J4Z1_SPIIN|nr:unnamed protein product [Spirodela intermedia]CAA6665306.1 unnamed protein product [Spirodela intermedia]
MSGARLHPPRSSSSSWAFPIFFFLLSQSSSGADVGSGSCLPHDCGDGVEIKYPLWYNDSTAISNASTNETICGHPDLGIRCQDNKPLLHLGGDIYQVAAVDYEEGTITLKDLDLLGDDCPGYIFFFFNCSEKPIFPWYETLYPLTCLGDNSYGLQWNISETPWNAIWGVWGVCNASVVSPVKKPDEQRWNLTTDFTRIVQTGFPLALNLSEAAKCRECEGKNWTCGYVRNRTTTAFAFTCLCNREGGACTSASGMLPDLISFSRIHRFGLPGLSPWGGGGGGTQRKTPKFRWFARHH